MEKDFDKWNKLKKFLNRENKTIFAHPREIWWCSLGLNLGAEIDGKNDNFERPVLVLHVYSRETMLALPITTKIKDDEFHYRIRIKRLDLEDKDYLPLEKLVWVKLTQSKVISNKRLLRKIDVVSLEDFTQIMQAFKNSI